MSIRNTITLNVLTTAEAAERLNVSKQRISAMVKEGKLTPVKRDSQGMMFLLAEIIDYQFRNPTRDMSKYFFDMNDSTTSNLNYYKENIDKLGDLRQIHIFYYDYDAVINNFYSEGDMFLTPQLRNIAAPRMVIRDVQGKEMWLGGCDCGHMGIGAHGTMKILMDLNARGKMPLPCPEEELENVIFFNTVVNLFIDSETEKTHFTSTKRSVMDKGRPSMTSYMNTDEIYLHNSNPVFLQDTYYIFRDEEEFFNHYRSFVPNPKEILIYTDPIAAREDGYVVSDNFPKFKEEPYQMIIKDKSGRELWLQSKLSKWMDPKKDANIRNILTSCGFELNDGESAKLLGWLDKGMSLITGKKEQPIRFVNID